MPPGMLVWWPLAGFAQNDRLLHSLDHLSLGRRPRSIFFQTHFLEGTFVDLFALLPGQTLGHLRVQHLESISLDACIFSRFLLRFFLKSPLLCFALRMDFG